MNHRHGRRINEKFARERKQGVTRTTHCRPRVEMLQSADGPKVIGLQSYLIQFSPDQRQTRLPTKQTGTAYGSDQYRQQDADEIPRRDERHASFRTVQRIERRRDAARCKSNDTTCQPEPGWRRAPSGNDQCNGRGDG